MKLGCILVILLLVGSCGYGGYYYYQKTHRPPEFGTEEVDEGEIRQVISATGSLAALTTVEVGTQVSGLLASIGVDFNDVVKENQQIAQIDPSTYEAQVQQMTANRENAKANERNITSQIENLKASMLTARADEKVSIANLKKAAVQTADAQRNLKRVTELQAKKLVSVSDLEVAQTNVDSFSASQEAASAQVEASKAKQAAILAQMESAKAQLEGAGYVIKQMQAQLNNAQINLEKTRIFSPIDGVVISRDVDIGQTVAANFTAPRLFTIAKDLKEMQISTAVDEADIGQVKEGQEVTFTVDAFRGRTFEGKVKQVRLAAIVTQNVVNYSVMVNVKNNDLSLKPGMTASVEILVDKRDKVLRLPTRALFFKPSPKSGIVDERGDRPKGNSKDGPKDESGDEPKDERKDNPKDSKEPKEPKEAKIVAKSEPKSESKDEPNSEFRAEKDPSEKWVKVWVMNQGTKPKPVRIKTGLGNNQSTEILAGKLKLGDLVVVEEMEAGSVSAGKGSSITYEVDSKEQPTLCIDTKMNETKSAPLVQIRGVHKTYFMDGVDVKALRGIDIFIQQGEFTAIMGASGSGKSTLMNILGCLDHPTKGQYLLDGQDVSRFSRDQLAEVRNRKIGFVFQGFNLLSRTSALENVELPLIYAGISGAERTSRAQEALASVGLAGREKHYSNQLSGGQQQRVAIARALVNRPAILLADEPTGNLDSRSSVEIMGIFQELNQKGITILLITHEPDISQYARRCILLRDGHVLSDQAIEKTLCAQEELKKLPVNGQDGEEAQE